VHQAGKKRPRRQNDRWREKTHSQLRDYTGYATIFDLEIIYSLLKNSQIFLILQATANGLPIQDPIRLGARCPNGRTLAGIQDPELNSGLIRCRRHCATQSIYFLDQMALSNPPDGGIAGHLSKGLDVVREQ
jgi:hypothetical protein